MYCCVHYFIADRRVTENDEDGEGVDGEESLQATATVSSTTFQDIVNYSDESRRHLANEIENQSTQSAVYGNFTCSRLYRDSATKCQEDNSQCAAATATCFPCKSSVQDWLQSNYSFIQFILSNSVTFQLICKTVSCLSLLIILR